MFDILLLSIFMGKAANMLAGMAPTSMRSALVIRQIASRDSCDYLSAAISTFAGPVNEVLSLRYLLILYAML